MRRTLAIAAAALLVLGVGSAPATAQSPGQPQSQTAPPAAATASVDAATAAWVTTFNTRDPKRIVALYAPDAAFWGTTAQALASTPEAVWTYFKDAGQRPNTRVRVDSHVARVYGDIAIDSGAYTFFDLVDGAETNVRPARFTFVYRRVGGRWLIVDHHSSRVPPAQ
jgi:uncharacterized protein (TIGR02246 family)